MRGAQSAFVIMVSASLRIFYVLQLRLLVCLCISHLFLGTDAWVIVVGTPGHRSSSITMLGASVGMTEETKEHHREQQRDEESASFSPEVRKGETRTVVPLPPVMQNIADERMEYNRKVGKAMDTLRRDYRDILVKKLDFDIYDKDIIVVDPSGVRLTGLERYKSAVAFLQTFCGFWFQLRSPGGGGCVSSRIQFRMMYDCSRCSIRISWQVMLIPKIPGLDPVYVDGISYYPLDRISGKITEHRIENLCINSRPVAPPYGILGLIQYDFINIRATPQGVPAGVGALSGGFQ